MDKNEMLSVIYEKIADKTLNFGCKIKIGDSDIIYTALGCPYKNNDDLGYWINCERKSGMSLYGNISSHRKDIKIIGHPVMIGDVLDYIEKINKTFTSIGDFTIIKSPEGEEKIIYEGYRLGTFEFGKALNLWQEKRNPIEDQSEECIEYIYNLISGEK